MKYGNLKLKYNFKQKKQKSLTAGDIAHENGEYGLRILGMLSQYSPIPACRVNIEWPSTQSMLLG